MVHTLALGYVATWRMLATDASSRRAFEDLLRYHAKHADADERAAARATLAGIRRLPWAMLRRVLVRIVGEPDPTPARW